MNEIRIALAEHAFFAGFDDRLLDIVAGLAEPADYPAGAWLARSGGEADRFHAVTGGRAGIELTAANREPILVSTVHPGEVVGWSWFVGPYRWHFDVVALDPLHTLAIDAVLLRDACEADHELGYQIARRLARVVALRLQGARHQLMDVYGSAR